MADNRLPEKLVQLDMLRLKAQYRKHCTCLIPHYDIDLDNYMIECRDCGAIIDPWDAIKRLTFHHKRMSDQIQRLLDQRREIDNYKPHLVVIKEIERNYRGPNVMFPHCPHCHEVIDLKDLVSGGWTSKAWYDKQKRGPEPGASGAKEGGK